MAETSRTVVGVFESMDDAQRAFDALEKEGFARDEISFIANKNAEHSWGGDDARTDAGDTASNVAADAGIGAALGGVGGLLLSFAGLAIPGIGPVLAAGPIVAALGGAGIGAAAGGLIGALTESGIPEEHAQYYAEGVRRGDILITVRTDGPRADRAAEILDDNGAVDIDDRASGWRERGWERHTPEAQPLSADEVRREREYRSAEAQQGDRWGRQFRGNTGVSGPGAGQTDFTAGTAGVTTGTGPGRMVGTEAGLGTGPGVTGYSDQGQHRGTAPTASPGGSLSRPEAANAGSDAARTSGEGTAREPLQKETADEFRDRSGYERNAAGHNEHGSESWSEKAREAGRDVKRGAARVYDRVTR